MIFLLNICLLLLLCTKFASPKRYRIKYICIFLEILEFARSNVSFCDIFPKESSNTGFTYVYVDFDCFYGSW